MRITEARGCDATPIPALNTEFRIAEGVVHQCRNTVCDLLDPKAPLSRFKRQAVAWQRGCDDSEGIGRVAAKPRRIGQTRDDLQELEHRSGPAVQQQQRAWRRPPT